MDSRSSSSRIRRIRERKRRLERNEYERRNSSDESSVLSSSYRPSDDSSDDDDNGFLAGIHRRNNTTAESQPNLHPQQQQQQQQQQSTSQNASLDQTTKVEAKSPSLDILRASVTPHVCASSQGRLQTQQNENQGTSGEMYKVKSRHEITEEGAAAVAGEVPNELKSNKSAVEQPSIRQSGNEMQGVYQRLSNQKLPFKNEQGKDSSDDEDMKQGYSIGSVGTPSLIPTDDSTDKVAPSRALHLQHSMGLSLKEEPVSDYPQPTPKGRTGDTGNSKGKRALSLEAKIKKIFLFLTSKGLPPDQAAADAILIATGKKGLPKLKATAHSAERRESVARKVGSSTDTGKSSDTNLQLRDPNGSDRAGAENIPQNDNVKPAKGLPQKDGILPQEATENVTAKPQKERQRGKPLVAQTEMNHGGAPIESLAEKKNTITATNPIFDTTGKDQQREYGRATTHAKTPSPKTGVKAQTLMQLNRGESAKTKFKEIFSQFLAQGMAPNAAAAEAILVLNGKTATNNEKKSNRLTESANSTKVKSQPPSQTAFTKTKVSEGMAANGAAVKARGTIADQKKQPEGGNTAESTVPGDSSTARATNFPLSSAKTTVSKEKPPTFRELCKTFAAEGMSMNEAAVKARAIISERKQQGLTDSTDNVSPKSDSTRKVSSASTKPVASKQDAAQKGLATMESPPSTKALPATDSPASKPLKFKDLCKQYVDKGMKMNEAAVKARATIAEQKKQADQPTNLQLETKTATSKSPSEATKSTLPESNSSAEKPFKFQDLCKQDIAEGMPVNEAAVKARANTAKQNTTQAEQSQSRMQPASSTEPSRDNSPLNFKELCKHYIGEGMKPHEAAAKARAAIAEQKKQMQSSTSVEAASVRRDADSLEASVSKPGPSAKTNTALDKPLKFKDLCKQYVDEGMTMNEAAKKARRVITEQKQRSRSVSPPPSTAAKKVQESSHPQQQQSAAIKPLTFRELCRKFVAEGMTTNEAAVKARDIVAEQKKNAPKTVATMTPSATVSPERPQNSSESTATTMSPRSKTSELLAERAKARKANKSSKRDRTKQDKKSTGMNFMRLFRQFVDDGMPSKEAAAKAKAMVAEEKGKSNPIARSNAQLKSPPPPPPPQQQQQQPKSIPKQKPVSYFFGTPSSSAKNKSPVVVKRLSPVSTSAGEEGGVTDSRKIASPSRPISKPSSDSSSTNPSPRPSVKPAAAAPQSKPPAKSQSNIAASSPSSAQTKFQETFSKFVAQGLSPNEAAARTILLLKRQQPLVAATPALSVHASELSNGQQQPVSTSESNAGARNPTKSSESCDKNTKTGPVSDDKHQKPPPEQPDVNDVKASFRELYQKYLKEGNLPMEASDRAKAVVLNEKRRGMRYPTE